MTCPQNAAMVIIVYKGTRFPAAQEWVAGMLYGLLLRRAKSFQGKMFGPDSAGNAVCWGRKRPQWLRRQVVSHHSVNK